MIKLIPLALLLAVSLTACSPAETSDVSEITLGNGTANQMDLSALTLNGPTLIIREVVAAQDSFLVLHPLENGATVKTDYVGATFVSAGTNTNVAIRLDEAPDTGTPFIAMLHTDVNGDRTFQFGDGVTVPDAPVIEGTTLIALPMQVPVASPVTPALIRTSASEHHDKAANFTERAPYRPDPMQARARALIHHYLSVVEGNDQTPESIQSLFAPEFLINFSSGPIDTVEAFDVWLKGPAASLTATRHVVHDLTVTPIDATRYTLGMDMTWDGLMSTGGGAHDGQDPP